MATASNKSDLVSKVDRHYGWRLGCDGFLNSQAVAERLGVHVHTVDKLRADGELRYMALSNGSNRHIRICKRSFEEYLSRQEQTNVQV